MIGGLKELFVEREVPREAAIQVAPMPRRILVVNAAEPALVEVAARLEIGRVSVTYVDAELAADERLGSVEPDQIWLFADGSSDAAYCGLIARELAERHRVAPLIAVFGECAGLRGDVVLDELRARTPIGIRKRASGAATRLTECGGR